MRMRTIVGVLSVIFVAACGAANVGEVESGRGDGSRAVLITDSDGDRIPDVDDKCPNDPETYNGEDDEDGCPDQGDVVLRCSYSPIISAVFFEHGSSQLKDASREYLRDFASTVADDKNGILRVQAAGAATSGEGSSEERVLLSRNRALAVEEFLREQGVQADVVSFTGYGDLCSASRSGGEKDRPSLRRVRLVVLESSPEGCTDEVLCHPPWCEKALEAGLVPTEDTKYIDWEGYCAELDR